MRCFELRSRYDELAQATWASEKDYREKHACEQCYGLGAAWRAHPVAIDFDLLGAPRGPIAVIGGCDASVIRADLARALAPHLPRPLFGRVDLKKPRATDVPGRWVTCVAGEGRGIDTERGPYCRHVFCATCGAGGNCVGWARGAILHRDIIGRSAFFSNGLRDILVTDALINELDLKRRFPDLRFREFPVVEGPLDGQVLPGDPEWDGIFRPRPKPSLPGDDSPWVQ